MEEEISMEQRVCGRALKVDSHSEYNKHQFQNAKKEVPCLMSA
ncbi:MAG: hypothetical protein U0989_20050 [Azonexus sp.]|nr:hypothetical protein [Azonexus sp.]